MILALPGDLTPWYMVPKDGEDVLWRCESRVYSYVIDADREEYGTTAPKLECFPWDVVRRTPKGAWIRYADGFGREERFVLLSARRRFAANTKIEALADFLDRKKRQLYVLDGERMRCKQDIELAKSVLERLK